jgi:hypothetical protein
VVLSFSLPSCYLLLTIHFVNLVSPYAPYGSDWTSRGFVKWAPNPEFAIFHFSDSKTRESLHATAPTPGRVVGVGATPHSEDLPRSSPSSAGSASMIERGIKERSDFRPLRPLRFDQNLPMRCLYRTRLLVSLILIIQPESPSNQIVTQCQSRSASVLSCAPAPFLLQSEAIKLSLGGADIHPAFRDGRGGGGVDRSYGAVPEPFGRSRSSRRRASDPTRCHIDHPIGHGRGGMDGIAGGWGGARARPPEGRIA